MIPGISSSKIVKYSVRLYIDRHPTEKKMYSRALRINWIRVHTGCFESIAYICNHMFMMAFVLLASRPNLSQFLELQNPVIHELYMVQKRHLTGFEALKRRIVL